MHFRKVSFKTVAFSSLEKLKKTILDIFFQHPSDIFIHVVLFSLIIKMNKKLDIFSYK